MLLVQALLKHLLGLVDNLFVDQRQEIGGIQGRVLHQNQDPNHGFLGICGHVEPVFHALDDRQQQVRIPGPDEGLVDAGDVFPLRRRVDPLDAVGQEHHRQVGVGAFDLETQVEDVHVVQVGHGDNQVERLLGQHFHGLGGSGRLGDPRRAA